MLGLLCLGSGCLEVPSPLADACPCATGWTCDPDLNQCVLASQRDPDDPSPPHNMGKPGSDSGASSGGDAGSHSGPMPDAGHGDLSDAGQLDAGQLDAGQLDASVPDAGGLDAGTADAGGSDAGTSTPDDAGGAGLPCDGGELKTWWRDMDGDGFGDAAQTVQACSKPTDHVGNDDDCDDSKVTTYPAAPELCDTLDNDCNGATLDACPAQCTPRTFEGHLYWFCSSPVDWQAASLVCAQGNLTLVRLESAAENDFVRAGAVELLSGLDVWLGGSDAAEQGVWRWADGTVFWRGTDTGTAENGAYTKWATGQPSGGTGEDCTELRTGNRWNDVTCNLLRQFACEQ